MRGAFAVVLAMSSMLGPIAGVACTRFETEVTSPQDAASEANDAATGAGDAGSECPSKPQRIVFDAPGMQSWTVPPCTTSITAKAWGAGGGASGIVGPVETGGAGGFASATLSVTSGEVLSISVGAGGQTGRRSNDPKAAGGIGFGKGGTGSGSHGSYTDYCGGGGGGGSGIARGKVVLITAGGGGGAGPSNEGSGGAGGGVVGESAAIACARPGLGGTATVPGANGAGGDGATLATGGDGANAGEASQIGLGGGGGGYYGGGAGGGSFGGTYCGGGGGSGFAPDSGTTVSGAGREPPNTKDGDYVADRARGGVKDAGAGGAGIVVISF